MLLTVKLDAFNKHTLEYNGINFSLFFTVGSVIHCDFYLGSEGQREFV